SYVWICAFTPIAARSAWIAVPMVFGDCIPEPDSVTQKVMLIGISTPDWSSSALARSGSYGYWLTWSVYAQPIAGGIGPTDGVPVPFRMSCVSASLLMA